MTAVDQRHPRVLAALRQPALREAEYEPDAPLVDEITEGLQARDAWISPKYLYDPLGSRLFEAITELVEYYPTRIERRLLERHIGAIAHSVGQGTCLIELGAGNCEKAAALFPVLRPRQYAALDISTDFLQSRISALRLAHPQVDMIPVAADLTAGIRLPGSVGRERRLFLYLGSSIGNFDPSDAYSMLADIREHCHDGGGLLIGVDLIKSVGVLQAAYDDPLGVTAAFNLNVLNHVNSLIGSNFDVQDWKHHAVFNGTRSRVEMHLEAARDALVAWPKGTRLFRTGQRIHTENSYKYLPDDFRNLLREVGFCHVDCWTDEQQWFALFHASV